MILLEIDFSLFDLTQIAIKHIKETAPREYHDFLIPNYRRWPCRTF